MSILSPSSGSSEHAITIALVCFLCILLCVCLAFLLTNKPVFDPFAEGGGPWKASDPGSVPSALVMDVARRLGLLDPGGGEGAFFLQTTVRLERSWSRRDGSLAWEVLVCRFGDLSTADFGPVCERVRLELEVGGSGAWSIVSRWVPGGPARPSSDALLLPGPDASVSV
jgi:hypothetical protein